MKNHFIIGYQGNKRNECPEIIKFLESKEDLKNVKIICEPYAGTAALSVFISKLYPMKFKYIINDTDEELIKLYNIMKDEEKLNNFIDEINLLLFDDKGAFLSKDNYLKIEDKFNRWFTHKKYYSLRPGLYPLGKAKTKLNKELINKLDIIKFLRNEDVEIKGMDGVKLIRDYKDNKDILFILDPPYLLSHNSTYYEMPEYETKNNIYEFFFYNREDIKFKFVFIVEDNWIIKLLLSNFNKITYEKTYNKSKKKTIHGVYTNL